MGFSAQISGGADLTAVRRQLRLIGDKGLGRQLSQGLQRAAKPLAPAIRESATDLLPSGYGPLLSKSMRFRTTVRERRGAARLTYRIFGVGKRENRDVPRINQGVLRHPVFGRRKKPWVNQRVRRGFVDRPVDRLAVDIRREMQAVVDQIADQITKG